jgi:selenoprotein W-related protein
MADTETTGVKVTITYCAECGYETQTLSLAEALMKAFTHELTSIELVPWYEGSFDVAINGEVVHSMYREGGFPDNSTMVEAVRKRLPAPSATVETA